ncbi:DUF2868 domain-containing protein [Variovorax sp. J22R24]|uniref:DUF2868 domain-containing protein n=1 Tax=Variovorax gracilis TaxID=3053502 RepID=UPI002577B128|nr:DUF2868 domain-containing protein [Variovorax sp. J22R24]MDM0104030.1 DUF2868 domain-containing protein [Variovorax sp. J22R24]
MAHPSPFQDATITEAVQLVEETGPLDDTQAMREAMSLQQDPVRRIVERARVLGQRIGLESEWARARSWSPWVLLGLVAVIVIAGLTLAGNVLGGSDRQINVVVALASLLGLHLITLALWLGGLFVSPGSVNASFGWLWLTLTARVAGGRRGQAPVLLRAVTRLLNRARLLPWALGFVSHAIWTLSFAVVLAAMLFALAFRNYTLSWETTILEPDFFVRSVQLLGRAPACLGFPVPDAQAVLSPLAAAPSQRAWALWLTGCIVVYGLLPRVAFVLLCAAVWQMRKKALRPDLSQPYFRKLLARFDALAPPHIVDADPGHLPHLAPHRLAAGDTTDSLMAVGFELPDELPWPPAALDMLGAQAVRIDGSASARRGLLDTLARVRPRRVLVGCHAASSPDRGTERFLREVMALSGECRLWLFGTAADDTARQRWHAWLGEAGLDGLQAGDALEPMLHGWT